MSEKSKTSAKSWRGKRVTAAKAHKQAKQNKNKFKNIYTELKAFCVNMELLLSEEQFPC